MKTILRTETFDQWLRKLKDSRGKARIIEEFVQQSVAILVIQNL